MNKRVYFWYSKFRVVKASFKRISWLVLPRTPPTSSVTAHILTFLIDDDDDDELTFNARSFGVQYINNPNGK